MAVPTVRRNGAAVPLDRSRWSSTRKPSCGATTSIRLCWGNTDADTVVWGNSDNETVVWGNSDSETVVWGNSCVDSSCAPIVWGSTGN